MRDTRTAPPDEESYRFGLLTPLEEAELEAEDDEAESED